MPYAAQADMVSRFGESEVIQLTDRANIGEIDAAVLASALASAEQEINAYCDARYTVPFLTVPIIVRDFSCDIARYRLCGAEVVETDEIRNRYKDAIKFFENVAKGVISLGLNVANQPQVQSAGVLVKSNSPVFNASMLRDY